MIISEVGPERDAWAGLGLLRELRPRNCGVIHRSKNEQHAPHGSPAELVGAWPGTARDGLHRSCSAPVALKALVRTLRWRFTK